MGALRNVLILAAVSSVMLSAPLHAAELKVLTAGAYKSVLQAYAPEFEKATGHKLTIDTDTAGGLVKRVEGGEVFDVVIVTPAGQAGLTAKGVVAEQNQKDLARVSIGVAVKEGAAKPDISSVAVFKKALMDAKSIALIDPAAGGSSGIYLTKLFESWGMADQMKAKSVLVPGGLVATRLVSGEAELAFQQISELIVVKGVSFVGPIPAEVQNYTVYRGARAKNSSNATAAEALLDALVGPSAVSILEQKGMERAN